MSSAESAVRHFIGLGLTLAVLWPLAPGVQDSFPLSTYPMFARPRGELTLHAVTGVRNDGSELPLGPELVGSEEVLQAKAFISASVSRGPSGLAELCAGAARRVAERKDLAEVARLEVLEKRYDPLAYFTVTQTPRERATLWQCAVPRSGKPR